MNVKALDLKTEPHALESVVKAANKKLTAHEVQEQRVSFAYGSLKSSSNVTRELVRKVVTEQEACAD